MNRMKWLKIATMALSAQLVSAHSYAEANLPSGENWLQHVEQGLAPYWMAEPAYGNPIGNFPTFRCNDGTILDINEVCPELNHGWISSNFGREYTRMKSRQTYAYGVLYHLTGNPKALEMARTGAYYLIEHLRDKQNGGFISFTKEGKSGLDWKKRTSQDQAYALVGLAMYYYLTRDPLIEKALIEQKNFIFEKYRLNDGKGLAWVLEDGDEQSAKQRELVAQLDQINAYLLLVAPLLPEAEKKIWLEDLVWITDTMLSHYYSDAEKRFYGAVHHKAVMMQNAKHNDFGHTIKAFWMTYLVAQQTQNSDWKELALNGMDHTLSQAVYTYPFNNMADMFSKQTQSLWKDKAIPLWQSRPYSNGTTSWEWAELDQAAMTLAMLNGSQTDKLYYTTRTYIEAWVDHEYGGVGLFPKTTKAFHWGNGYHQFEHALIGYISAQQFDSKPVELHYAFSSQNTAGINPYYFKGKLETIERLSATKQGLPRQKITFSSIKP